MSTASQIRPPAPEFTEKSLIDLSQKVFIITGATSGIGLALAKILYDLHATVYIGARSLEKFKTANDALVEQCPDSKGELKPFIADMADLASIKPTVDAFLAKEWRLDVLFLNAGVMSPPAGSKTKDGFDLELGVNCLAPFLLATSLYLIMASTASHFCHPNPSIRVVWVSALLNLSTPSGGVQFDAAASAPKQFKATENYMQSKAGVYLLAHEFPIRQRQIPNKPDPSSHTLPNSNPSGVQHIVINPGFTRTNIQRFMSGPARGVMTAVFKSPKYGAYTALYAGFGFDVRSGDFVIPWGRKETVPEHIVESTIPRGGEESLSSRFNNWCEEQVKPFIWIGFF